MNHGSAFYDGTELLLFCSVVTMLCPDREVEEHSH
jgi:hypothetical protein